MANSALQLRPGLVLGTEHLNSFRNKVINGGFDVWQRGTSIATSSGNVAFLADRWAARGNPGLAGGTMTTTMSRQSFVLGQTDVPGNPRYYIDYASNINGGPLTGLEGVALVQRVENVRILENHPITFSFYAKGSVPGTIWVNFGQFVGVTGAGNSGFGHTPITLTTSWQRYIVHTTVPSLSGTTISGGDDSFRVRFVVQAGPLSNLAIPVPFVYTGTVSIANVQLEEGTIEDPQFEQLPIETIWGLCQRYYAKTYQETIPGGTPGGLGGVEGFEADGSSGYDTVPFFVSMRTAPSVSIWDLSLLGLPNSAYNYGANFFCNVALHTVSEDSFTMFYSAANNATSYFYQWVADAEL